MKDKRYIKINGKPVLVIYNTINFPTEKYFRLIQKFRRIAKQYGFSDLFVMISTRRPDDKKLSDFDVDALLEYQPHSEITKSLEVLPKGYLNPDFQGKILDTNLYIAQKQYLQPHKGGGSGTVCSYTMGQLSAKSYIGRLDLPATHSSNLQNVA